MCLVYIKKDFYNIYLNHIWHFSKIIRYPHTNKTIRKRSDFYFWEILLFTVGIHGA